MVTLDLSCSPEAVLAPHGIPAQHPDEFAGALAREPPEAFLDAVRTHRAFPQHPPKSAEEYRSTLSECGLPRTAAGLGQHRGVVQSPPAPGPDVWSPSREARGRPAGEEQAWGFQVLVP
jgi:hypothetical protein